MNQSAAHTALVNSILDWLAYQPMGIFWPTYNGGIWNSKRGCYMRNSRKVQGVSDICGIWLTGKGVVIECKTGKGVLSPAQQDFFIRVRRAGGIAIEARSIEDVARGLGIDPRRGKSPSHGGPGPL